MSDETTNLANDIRLACQRISRRVRFEGTHEIAPHQFSVLIRLSDGPLTPRELADIERVSAPSMTRTINCLADLGLVTRSPHPTDGRQVLVSRTDAGSELCTRTMVQRDTWMLTQLDQLSPAELATLRDALPVLTKVANA